MKNNINFEVTQHGFKKGWVKNNARVCGNGYIRLAYSNKIKSNLYMCGPLCEDLNCSKDVSASIYPRRPMIHTTVTIRFGIFFSKDLVKLHAKHIFLIKSNFLYKRDHIKWI